MLKEERDMVSFSQRAHVPVGMAASKGQKIKGSHSFMAKVLRHSEEEAFGPHQNRYGSFPEPRSLVLPNFQAERDLAKVT